jgi:hypothetical protein
MSDRGRLRLLTIAVVVNLAATAAVAAFAVTRPAAARGPELSVERLNIVGADGKPLLVLASRSRIPGPTVAGKEYPRRVSDGREYLSGLIFFNEQGDEVGGLVFNGITKPDGGYSAVGHLSFDQWKQNQVVAIQYIDGGKSRRAGLNIWDRPTDVPLSVELDRIARKQEATGATREALDRESAAASARGEQGVQRVFLGSQDRAAQLVLRDTKGRVRIRLAVDASDRARLEFLDETGAVRSSYPPAE